MSSFVCRFWVLNLSHWDCVASAFSYGSLFFWLLNEFMFCFLSNYLNIFSTWVISWSHPHLDDRSWSKCTVKLMFPFIENSTQRIVRFVLSVYPRLWLEVKTLPSQRASLCILTTLLFHSRFCAWHLESPRHPIQAPPVQLRSSHSRSMCPWAHSYFILIHCHQHRTKHNPLCRV